MRVAGAEGEHLVRVGVEGHVRGVGAHFEASEDAPELLHLLFVRGEGERREGGRCRNACRCSEALR